VAIILFYYTQACPRPPKAKQAHLCKHTNTTHTHLVPLVGSALVDAVITACDWARRERTEAWPGKRDPRMRIRLNRWREKTNFANLRAKCEIWDLLKSGGR